MAKVETYRHYFLGMFNELMRIYDAEHNYEKVHTSAAKTLLLVSDNPDIYFWLIRSDIMRHHFDVARSELRMAEAKLLEEDYKDLQERLTQNQQQSTGCLAAMMAVAAGNEF